MKYLIDYFMFVLKPDKHAQNPYPDKISLGYILDLLGLNEEFANFVDIGSHLHYEKCYCYQNIRIYCPYSSDFDVMGYCIEMSGSGCRFFESLFGALTFSWKDFFLKLRNCVTNGLSLNINRVDFAFDDYDKKLDLSKIEECAKKREYVSLFRSVSLLKIMKKLIFKFNLIILQLVSVKLFISVLVKVIAFAVFMISSLNKKNAIQRIQPN